MKKPNRENADFSSRRLARFDGQTIASGSVDGEIKLWQRDGTLIVTLKGHQDEIRGLSFDPDNPILASASLDSTIILWNLEDFNQTILDNLLVRSCDWVGDYLKTNPNVTERDRLLCNE